MKLTEHEKSLLNGAEGKGPALAMKILTGIGDAMDADVFVPVQRSHVSLSNQEADLWFAEKMFEGRTRTKICATVNPGFDIDYFGGKKLVSDRNIKLMERCIDAYKQMGFILSFTCTPYLDGNLPALHETVTYSESSATAFVNSAIGAMTNPESAQSAMCSAIVGLTPRYGFLIESNRKASIYVDVQSKISDEFDYSILGWVSAKKIGRKVPLFRGSFTPSTEGLINLGAELNTAGRVPLFHIQGITPEADFAQRDTTINNTLVISEQEINEAKESFCKQNTSADAVMLGCPHYSCHQICLVHRLLSGNKAKIPVFILTSASVAEQIANLPMQRDLLDSNVTIIGNTCIDQPCWEFLTGKHLLTDSPKCCYYAVRRNLEFTVLPMFKCLEMAVR